MSRSMELDIAAVAAGGDGVGRAQELVVFVPRTAPGDRVRARVTTKRSFGRGTLERIVSPSPDRVEPPCGHYVHDRCGGCQIQHLRYDAQLAAKAQLIVDGVQRIGKREAALPRVNPSEPPWRYRSKLTLAMRRRGPSDRSASTRRRWVIGLHPYDDPVGVFQLEDCPITDERVVSIWREIMAASELLPDAVSLRGAVRLLDADGASFVLEGGARWDAFAGFAAAVPSVTAVWWEPEGKERRQLSGSGVDTSASFAQVNPGVAQRLHEFVIQRAHECRPETVVDGYAGSGATAIPLARGGTRVIAIELDAAAAQRCADQLPPGSRAITGRVEDVLPTALPADLVLLNPPRTGLHESVPALLQSGQHPPANIIYTSCNPATLGRDLARMPRYRITHLEGFDMFPQTAHVETVCQLALAEGAA